jgi:hypothetical protein
MEIEPRLNAGHGLRNEPSPSTSRWRRPRSSANLLQQAAQPAQPLFDPSVAKSAPKVERVPSKMTIFNLFSRPKVEKARGHTEVGLAVPMAPPSPKPAPVSTSKSSLRLNPAPQTHQVHRSRSSQMLRPLSTKPANVKKQSGNWDPPPLFQAYPQSIKHATLQTCVYSPDILIRAQSQRRTHDTLRERTESHRDLATTLEAMAESIKSEKSHKRLISNSVMSQTAPQLTSKVFVLDTSGHVLQYAGDGPFDRQPEKLLKLGKESVAFACNLIPGKPWVLQISQSTNEDGTVSVVPRSSLLSRLRLHSASVKQAATSFLLVLESAEEMDSWMTTVRKEINTLGGMKAKEESIRESSSLEEPSVQTEAPSHRFLVQRDPNSVSKMAPVDSPLQSQYSESPKIVASDWDEKTHGEKTASIADTASVHSSRNSSKRKSVEAPSIATTVASTEQFQLDQLRERSRYSYMSTTTSVSGPGTRNTSRNSSPAPDSPLKEGFSTADPEPLRTATSLRSFHMSARRRSVQPLPVTNEDTSASERAPMAPQSHSIYDPTSPTIKNPEKFERDVPVSIKTYRPNTSARRISTQTPIRSGLRSSSAPPARNTNTSPPPQGPAPTPQGRPQSTIGSLPSAATLATRERRISQSPKPFLRPFPVRPQNTDGSIIVPRRYSSMAPGSMPPPIPIGIKINRSVTGPLRPSPAPISASPTFNRRFSPPSQQSRRPNSVQVRSGPIPLILAPVRAISSTPSFVPGNRASASPSPSQGPSIPVLRQQAQRSVTPRRSIPVMGLPPPAPPPNMPLPPPPPNMPLPQPPAFSVPRVSPV